MFTARKKIQKEKNAEPSEFEESVAQARSLRPLAACLQRLLRLAAHGLGAPRQEPGARQSASTPGSASAVTGCSCGPALPAC